MPQTASPHARPIGHIVLGIIALWAALIAGLSAAGAFTAFPLPLFAGLVALLLVVAISSYFLHADLRLCVERFGIRRLTAIHLWRIPAALAFFHYGGQGLLPPTFVMLAGWGDMLAGVLALTIVLFWSRSRRAYWTFHIVGIADFVLAVGTGLTLSLLADPRMETIALFPLALIPLFGVTLSGATHIAAFDMLLRGRGIYRVISNAE
ncbi:MAG: permease [Pseudomonadota bacterium]